MQCEQFNQLVCRLTDLSASPRLRVALREHAEACRECFPVWSQAAAMAPLIPELIAESAMCENAEFPPADLVFLAEMLETPGCPDPSDAGLGDVASHAAGCAKCRDGLEACRRAIRRMSDVWWYPLARFGVAIANRLAPSHAGTAPAARLVAVPGGVFGPAAEVAATEIVLIDTEGNRVGACDAIFDSGPTVAHGRFGLEVFVREGLDAYDHLACTITCGGVARTVPGWPEAAQGGGFLVRFEAEWEDAWGKPAREHISLSLLAPPPDGAS